MCILCRFSAVLLYFLLILRVGGLEIVFEQDQIVWYSVLLYFTLCALGAALIPTYKSAVNHAESFSFQK